MGWGHHMRCCHGIDLSAKEGRQSGGSSITSTAGRSTIRSARKTLEWPSESNGRSKAKRPRETSMPRPRHRCRRSWKTSASSFQTIRTRKSYSADLSVCGSSSARSAPHSMPRQLRQYAVAGRRSQTGGGQNGTPTREGGFLEEITASLIEGFIARRIREDGIAPKTANRCREVLHRMFEYATRTGASYLPTGGVPTLPRWSSAGGSLLPTYAS